MPQDEAAVSAAFMTLWRELDADDERETMRKEEAYGSMSDDMHVQTSERKRVKRGARGAEIEAGYDGPHLPTTYGLPDVLTMMDRFSEGKRLHYTYAARLVEDVHQVLLEQPTVCPIAIPKQGRLVVCGDTHGQFNDLRTIFRMNGMPSELNLFLFNGDFVDRGPNGTEVLFTLYALKKLFPQYLFLNRGNHEVLTATAAACETTAACCECGGWCWWLIRWSVW